MQVVRLLKSPAAVCVLCVCCVCVCVCVCACVMCVSAWQQVQQPVSKACGSE